MKINILGSHGSDLLMKDGQGGQACRSVGLLINDRLLVDAGTAASERTIEQQQSLEHVLISHYHLDHVKELPSLADNLVTHGVASRSSSFTPTIRPGCAEQNGWFSCRRSSLRFLIEWAGDRCPFDYLFCHIWTPPVLQAGSSADKERVCCHISGFVMEPSVFRALMVFARELLCISPA